jgi:molybdopterin converting factor small subunit
MPKVIIPTPLQPYVEGQKTITARGSTIREVILNLTTRYPAVSRHVFDPDGRLRGFIKIYLEENNRLIDIAQLDSKINENDCLKIIASIAGG